MFNRDTFANVSVQEAATATMSIIDSIQDLGAGVQQAAITAAFLAVTKHNNISPLDAFEITNNVINHAQGKRPEFAAVDMYVEKELKGKV